MKKTELTMEKFENVLKSLHFYYCKNNCPSSLIDISFFVSIRTDAIVLTETTGLSIKKLL